MAIGLAKSTWYYRQKQLRQGPSEQEKMLKAEIKDIIAEHPAYGYRRILPELKERTGLQVGHKRLKRLLREHDLGLRRCLPAFRPSAAGQVLRRCRGHLKQRASQSGERPVVWRARSLPTSPNCSIRTEKRI